MKLERLLNKDLAVDSSKRLWSRSNDTSCTVCSMEGNEGWHHKYAEDLPKDSIYYEEGRRGFVLRWIDICDDCTELREP